MIGQPVSHCGITAKLGEGGMGKVAGGDRSVGRDSK